MDITNDSVEIGHSWHETNTKIQIEDARCMFDHSPGALHTQQDLWTSDSLLLESVYRKAVRILEPWPFYRCCASPGLDVLVC